MSRAFTWDDPFRTGFAGTYDPGTMYGLIFRAQAGDMAAKNHLAQAGFFDAYGNDVWGAYNKNAGGTYNIFGAVDAWAKSRGLNLYNGANPFRWNSAWGDANAPGFQQAWNSAWNSQAAPATGGTTQPQTAPSGTTYQDTGTGPFRAPWAQGGYGKPNSYFYNGHNRSDNGADGDWVVLPVAYNPNGDTKRWEYNGTNQEPTMRRAVRHAYDMMQQGKATNFQHALSFTMARLYNEAGGQGVGYSGQFAQTAYGEQYDPNKVYLVGVAAAGGGAAGGGAGAGGAGGAAPGTAPGTGAGGGLPPGYAGSNSGTSGGLTPAQRMAISADPNQAYRYMMQQLGYNPSAPGLLGRFLKQRFQPLLEARMAAAGVSDNGSYMDTIDQIVNEFGGGMFERGGDFFGNLRHIGTQAAQAGAPYLDSLQNQEQAMQYLNQLGMLRYAGANPLVQQAIADEMQRARESYQDVAFDKELSGQNLDPFTRWLMSSRFRPYFGY